MKKQLTKKPLHLSRETLRQLSDKDLTSVPGGGASAPSCKPTVPSQCDPPIPE
jgi:hypothetical protein